MATQKKIDVVKELTDKLNRTKAFFVAEYEGLTHKQLEEVRKKLKKVEGELAVVKNNLLKRALKESKKTVDESVFNGPSASLFAYKDEIAPLKELVTFFKTATKGKVKFGLMGNDPVAESDIERLSSLPTRNVLLSKLVGQLQAPVQGLHNALSWNIRKLVWTLDAVKSKKQ